MPRIQRTAPHWSRRGDLIERPILLPLKLAERPHKCQELTTLFQISTKTISRHIDRLPNHHLITEDVARLNPRAPSGQIWGRLCVR